MPVSMTRLLYRLFHGIKHFLIKHKPWVLTWLFFSLLPLLEKLVSARREDKFEKLQRDLCRQIYFTKYSRTTPPFVLKTDHAVAVHSDDHLWPHGTLHDNSSNRLFNVKLYDLLKYKPDLKLLDMGCSGGAFVRSVLEDGYTAVGLEGSDVSKKLSSAEWGVIPLHLFTCDITEPFQLEFSDGGRMLFDVITAWEVLEHIPKAVLKGLIQNIYTNLNSGGYFIASVANFPDENPLTGAVYHVTLEPRNWWISQFLNHGFSEVVRHKFITKDWVRGNGQGLTNWSPGEGDYGSHLVLQKSAL
jgi:2-polyprenyl-3-methyl-5-hydroxy-6-metoxy-1,4-benzoquinol methylase